MAVTRMSLATNRNARGLANVYKTPGGPCASAVFDKSITIVELRSGLSVTPQIVLKKHSSTKTDFEEPKPSL